MGSWYIGWIRTMRRSIIQHMKRALFSRYFLISVAMAALLVALDYLPLFLMGIREYQGQVYYSYDVLALSYLCGDSIFLGITFIVATLPYAGVMCADRESHILTLAVKRSSPLGYAVGSVIACGISAFLCIFLAYLLGGSIYHIWIPLDNGQPGGVEMYGLIQEGKTELCYLAKICLNALRGTFFAICSLTLSALVKNRYVIYSLPFILFYFLMRFGYTVMDLPSYLNVRGVYFDYVFGPEKELLSVGYSLLFTLGVMCATVPWLCVRIRRML